MTPEDIAEFSVICAVPSALVSERLQLACWHPNDADELLPTLEMNWDHLSPWIPARVATPSPLPELAARLSDYAAKFSNNLEWRYAIRDAQDYKLLGEVAMFPRSESGRVSFHHADRAELGYWLRSDENGRGYATEATLALLSAARPIRQFRQFEIRCDPRNLRSRAIPERLGFTERSSGSEDTTLYCLENTPQS